MSDIMQKYLEINYPYFIKEYSQNELGILIKSELHSKFFNQLVLTSSITDADQVRKCRDWCNRGYSLALDLLTQNKSALPILVKSGLRIADQEHWFMGNVDKLNKIKTLENIKKINYSNIEDFEKLVKVFFAEKGVTDNFTNICRQALTDSQGGNLFSVYIAVKDGKVKGAAGYVFSPKKELGHINFVLTLDDSKGYEYDLIHAIIQDSQYLKITKILLIKTGTLRKSEDLIKLGFELESIYLSLVA